MIKLLSSIFFAAFLSFSCTDSPNTEDNPSSPTTQDGTAAPVAETPVLAEELPEETPVENTDNSPSEEPTASPEPTPSTSGQATPSTSGQATPSTSPTPKEEPIKDKARPRGDDSQSEPSSDPTPKNTSTSTPPTNNKSNNTTTNTSSSETGKTVGTKPGVPALSHDKLDALLRKHVSSSGKVDYKAFKKDHAVLEDYINMLELNPPKSDWSKNKQMAYWINLYNAFTIHTILENYPVNSIMDIAGGKVWDSKTINIGGEKLTLNKIEKDKLLKRFKEPRVHFAVNCAAASCPPLLNKAWTEDNVQRYLQKQAEAFINNSQYNQLSAKSIQVSQIFNWYAADFGGKDKILPYIQKYADTEIKDNAKVTYNEYDWGLNN